MLQTLRLWKCANHLKGLTSSKQLSFETIKSSAKHFTVLMMMIMMMIILKKMQLLGVPQQTTKCLSQPWDSIAWRSWRLIHWQRALTEEGILSVRSSKLETWDLREHTRKRASVSIFWFSYCSNIDIIKGKDLESNKTIKNILVGHRKQTASILVRKGGESKIRNDVKFKVRSPCYILTPFADDIQALCQVPSPPSQTTTPWLPWGLWSIERDHKTAKKKNGQKSLRNRIQ